MGAFFIVGAVVLAAVVLGSAGGRLRATALSVAAWAAIHFWYYARLAAKRARRMGEAAGAESDRSMDAALARDSPDSSRSAARVLQYDAAAAPRSRPRLEGAPRSTPGSRGTARGGAGALPQRLGGVAEASPLRPPPPFDAPPSSIQSAVSRMGGTPADLTSLPSAAHSAPVWPGSPPPPPPTSVGPPDSDARNRSDSTAERSHGWFKGSWGNRRFVPKSLQERARRIQARARARSRSFRKGSPSPSPSPPRAPLHEHGAVGAAPHQDGSDYDEYDEVEGRSRDGSVSGSSADGRLSTPPPEPLPPTRSGPPRAAEAKNSAAPRAARSDSSSSSINGGAGAGASVARKVSFVPSPRSSPADGDSSAARRPSSDGRSPSISTDSGSGGGGGRGGGTAAAGARDGSAKTGAGEGAADDDGADSSTGDAKDTDASTAARAPAQGLPKQTVRGRAMVRAAARRASAQPREASSEGFVRADGDERVLYGGRRVPKAAVARGEVFL